MRGRGPADRRRADARAQRLASGVACCPPWSDDGCWRPRRSAARSSASARSSARARPRRVAPAPPRGRLRRPNPPPRTRAAAVESGLVAAAEAVLERWPTTRSVVLPVRDGHAAHVVALVGSTSPSPSPSGTGAAGSTPTPAVGSTRSAALRDLAGLERGAARAHAVGAQPAAPADARLIATSAVSPRRRPWCWRGPPGKRRRQRRGRRPSGRASGRVRRGVRLRPGRRCAPGTAARPGPDLPRRPPRGTGPGALAPAGRPGGPGRRLPRVRRASGLDRRPGARRAGGDRGPARRRLRRPRGRVHGRVACARRRGAAGLRRPQRPVGRARPVFPGLPERAATPTPTGTSTPAGSPTPSPAVGFARTASPRTTSSTRSTAEATATSSRCPLRRSSSTTPSARPLPTTTTLGAPAARRP